MGAQAIGTAEWAEITRLLLFVFLFCGLGVTSALGVLLGHAVLSSLLASQDVSGALSLLRWGAYPLAALALVLTLYSLA